MKTPGTCSGMEEIRADVNEIDRDIIRLLGRRLAYVRAAVRCKVEVQLQMHRAKAGA